MEPIGIESDDDDISAISDRAAIEDEFLNEYASIPPTQNSPIEDLHMEDSQDPNELPSSDLFSPEDKALPYVPVEKTAPVKNHVFGETSPESREHGSRYDELVYGESPIPVKDDHDKVALKKTIAKLRKQKSALIQGFEFRKVVAFCFPSLPFQVE